MDGLSGSDWGRLGYLLLLLLAVGGYFVAQMRSNANKTLQQAAVWGLIFVGAIAGFALWEDIRSSVMPGQAVFSESGRVEVPRSPDGHFYLTLQLDGVPVRFVVDTGASDIVLARQDAERIGIDAGALTFTGRAMTANGAVGTAPVRIGLVELGEIADRNVRAVVNEGEMHESLLGMAYLERFGRMEIAGDELVLTR